jgi:hypothetical protein
MTSSNAINTDGKKRGAFVAPLLTTGYGERYPIQMSAYGIHRCYWS